MAAGGGRPPTFARVGPTGKRNEGRLAVCVLVERGRLLRRGSDVGKLPVVPHAVHQERPARGLVVQLIRELQARGIGRAKGIDLGAGVLAHGGDLRLGLSLRGVHGRAAFLGHQLILGHAGARDERGDVAGGRGGGRIAADADDQVWRGVSLRHQERIDPAALAHERDVGGDAFADGLQKGEIGRAGQVSVLGVPDNEIEDGLSRRQLNHGGVPDARVDADDLIGLVLYVQDGRAGRRVGGVVRRLRLGDGTRETERQERSEG